MESWVPCNIFETQLFEEDCFEQNEECSQGLNTSDKTSLISDIDGDDDYWTFIENPTCDTFENIFGNLVYDVSIEFPVPVVQNAVWFDLNGPFLEKLQSLEVQNMR